LKTIFFLLCSAVSLHAHDWNVWANVFLWTARESGSDCWAEVITTQGSASSNRLEQVNFGWDPGFRAGVGYGMRPGHWDAQASYTWFHTRGTDSVSSLAGTVHSAFLGNFYIDNAQGNGLSGPAYQKAGIDWAIRFNMFDWELGRSFQIGESLVLRPFAGAKGGWIHQSIASKWENPDLTGSFAGSPAYSVGVEKLNNNFWGIGPQGGVHSEWMLFSGENQAVCLFGDFSGAMMWGHWSFGDLFSNDVSQRVVVDFASVNSGATMIRSFMGFGWDWRSVSLKVGYETQFWLDQLQFYSFTAGRLDNTLTLQGGTLAFSVDY